MTIKKGEIKNPAGGKGRAMFYEALMIELKDVKHADKRGFRAIARKLLDLAADGDIQAIKYVMDRVDGSPIATIDHTVTDRRTVREMSDDELCHIAAGGSTGDSEPEGGEEIPDRVH